MASGRLPCILLVPSLLPGQLGRQCVLLVPRLPSLRGGWAMTGTNGDDSQIGLATPTKGVSGNRRLLSTKSQGRCDKQPSHWDSDYLNFVNCCKFRLASSNCISLLAANTDFLG
ncbi:unnamed protein product [Protopolystoma xenopodis]|uniref:Secreted protein n=1 Tax=Protopolystoma xenopodis TaxID=117903 RepID=A0A3S5FHG7_9PLAT|nr:unnamed protein product [Protopolystoma xenopodis]